VTEAHRLVDEPRSCCHVLHDDGVSTIEHTEQLTHLLRTTSTARASRTPLRRRHLDAFVDAFGPVPEVIAREIVDDLTAALPGFEAVALALEEADGSGALRSRTPERSDALWAT
jgi:hypothetical protein